MERILNAEELEEFAVDEGVNILSKYILLKAEVKEYDADRLLSIISGELEKNIKKKTLKKLHMLR